LGVIGRREGWLVFFIFFCCFCDGCILAEHSRLCDWVSVSTTCCAVGSIPEGLRDRQVGLAYPGIVMPFGGRMPGLAVCSFLSINKRDRIRTIHCCFIRHHSRRPRPSLTVPRCPSPLLCANMSHPVGPAVLPKDGRPALRAPRTDYS